MHVVSTLSRLPQRQLYSLWKGVEDKKCDTRVELKKTLDTTRGNLALDKTMEVQVGVVGRGK